MRRAIVSWFQWIFQNQLCIDENFKDSKSDENKYWYCTLENTILEAEKYEAHTKLWSFDGKHLTKQFALSLQDAQKLQTDQTWVIF